MVCAVYVYLNLGINTTNKSFEDSESVARTNMTKARLLDEN